MAAFKVMQGQVQMQEKKTLKMSRKCFYIKSICVVFSLALCFFHQLTSESQVTFHRFDECSLCTVNLVSCQKGYPPSLPPRLLCCLGLVFFVNIYI